MPEGTEGTAGTGTTGTGTAGTGTEAAAPWHGLPGTDTEGLAYLKNKGWQSPGDVIKSYQGAEKLIGRDPGTLIPMPRADDPVGLRAVQTKLGLPETADKYEFDKPSDLPLDDGYMAWARSTFHKVGLTASQVKELTKDHNAYLKGVLAQQDKDYNLKIDTEKTALLGEWKGGHERMINAAQTAARSLGFTGEMIDSLERSIGYAGTMKFFAELGKKMGEDGFVTGGAGSSRGFDNAMTPAEAKAEWESIKADPTKVAALRDAMHPSHKALKEKQSTLFKVMYPEG
jgi:hypothetical protein